MGSVVMAACLFQPAFTLSGKGHELRWLVLAGSSQGSSSLHVGRDVCLLELLWKWRPCTHAAGFLSPSVVPDQVCMIYHFKNILF